MAILCPHCRTVNPDNSRFCGNCASPLYSPDPAENPTLDLPTPVKGLARGSLFAKRYEVIEDLGEGGMGHVYRVLDIKIREEIALKIIRPQIAADPKTLVRFSNELKIARKISHKNICRMFHLGEEAGAHYITMEFVDGEDLKRMIRMAKPFTEKTALGIARQICEGLAEAHRQGIVHRDLKPSNIMIDRNGNVRILDFGIARSMETEEMTRTGAMIGTPEYMSPELVDGRKADARSDIYSLGIILYEMVSGRPPFGGDNPLSIAFKHKTEYPLEPRALNPGISQELNGLILKCLEKNNERRYPSAQDLRDDLIQLERRISSEEKTAPKTRAATVTKYISLLKKRWPWAAFLLTAMTITSIVIFLGQKKERLSTPQTIHTLVVLPFENLGESGDAYFADGITEEITNRLSGLHGLRVISRTSAIQYKKIMKTINRIRADLGADYALEGTIRWDQMPSGSGRVRITPKLVRTADSTQIWSETYDRVLEDFFSLQSEIAEEVTKKLDITLFEPERIALSARPTKNTEAYGLFLKAQGLSNVGYMKQERPKLDEAVTMLEMAVRLDPGFAQAYEALFDCHYIFYMSGFDRSAKRLAKAKEAIDQALELQPDSPTAKIRLGRYYYRAFQDYDRASEIFESVVREHPNIVSPVNPAVLLGYIQRRRGQWEEALATMERAFKLDPYTPDTAFQIAMTYLALRRFEEAEAWYARAFGVNPDFLMAKISKAELLYYWRGETKEARIFLESLPRESIPTISRFALEMYDRRYEEALKVIEAMSEDTIEQPNTYETRDLLLASVYWTKKDWSRTKKHAELALSFLEKTSQEVSDDPRIYAALGRALAYLGRKEEAILSGKQAVSLCPAAKDAVDSRFYVLNLASIYAIVGEFKEAVFQLEYLLSIPAGDIMTVPYLALDPQWDPLRNDPGFKRLTGLK
jgi:serine/threonine protein kinase/Flp pilus assembly protein TadD